MTTQIYSKLDAEVLAQEFSILRDYRAGAMSLDELGSAVSLALQGCGPLFSPVDIRRYGQQQMQMQQNQQQEEQKVTDYWPAVKREAYILLCSDDIKYTDLRKSLSGKSDIATTYILSTISAAVASQVNLTLGMVTPLIAVLLHTFARLGIGAWCQIQTEVPEPIAKAEQGVAPQSATRSELDSEGGENPKQGSEPRPR